jgi:hypothetical protein
MNNESERPTLSIVPGAAGVAREPRSRATLASVPPPAAVAPQQLRLEGVPARTDTLISVGLHGLTFMSFATLLRKHGVRVVLDLRVSSSFRGNGFSMQQVFTLFDELRIHYRRLPALADRRDDCTLNEHVRQRRYAAFLDGCIADLVAVRSLILKGPAVLLGWESAHLGSDRAILADALQRVGSEPFELVVAPAEHNTAEEA